VKATLNLSGLVGVQSAQLVETTEVEEPVVAPTPAPAAATPAAAPSEGPEKMATDEPAKPAATAAEAPKPEIKKKTVTKLTNLTIQADLPNAIPPQQVKQLAEEESKMVADDRVFIETADRYVVFLSFFLLLFMKGSKTSDPCNSRNALETYILNMRSKLQGVRPFPLSFYANTV
jgi:hypothetical protein